MTPRPRAALAALLAGLLLALPAALLGGSAHAEQTPTGPSQPGATSGPVEVPRVADQVKDARAVFAGTVEGVRRVTGQTGQAGAGTGDATRAAGSTLTVVVDRVYKPSSDRVVTTQRVEVTLGPAGIGCPTRSVQVGQSYVFFAGFTEDELTATPCTDVVVATAALVAEVEELLGGGRDAVPVDREPVVAELTEVEASSPPSFTRAAAPGVAFLLVGLLGLLGLAAVRRMRNG